MKRTRLTSALLTASVLLSTTTTATFAGHRGGNGGGGNSFKGNGGGTQMMRSNGNNSFGGQFKQNVGNNFVQKQQFTQKFVPTVKPHTNGTITNNLGNIKTFPSNHVITGKNLGTDLKVKLPQTFPSSPNGPTFPGTKVGGIKINDTIKTGPFFPSPTGGVKVPGGPILPPGGSGGGSGSGSGGGSGGGSGSGSGGGSGSGSGSGGGKGNCHNNSCHGNWWYPLGWGWNNSYTGYCGGCYNTGYCGTGYYGSNFCGTYGPAVYSTPVVVNPAPVSVSTPVIVNVKEAEAATTVTAAQATPTTSSTPELIEMTLGQTYALQGPGLGNDAGQVMLEVSDIALGVKAVEWTDAKVGFTLPMFGMSKPTTAKLHLVSSEGKLLRSAEVRLVLPTATTAQK